MLIGGVSRALGTNAGAGEPDGWFAAEACEYDRTFHRLAPQGATISNVEADHLDYYGDLESIKNAFARFADRVHPEGLIVCGRDVPRRVEEAARCPVWRLGRELSVDLLAEREGCFSFRLRGPGFETPRIDLAVPGRFNVENASLALGLAVGLVAPSLGLTPEEAAVRAARGLERFTGCQRRFEPWGSVGGVELIHDYAHHPTEVRVVLEAARRALPKRSLHVLFQPHQHGRTARFLDDFVEALRFADRVVVTEVYGAREAPPVEGERRPAPLAGAPELADKLVQRGVRAVAPGSLAASIECFVDGLPDASAGLVLGAGDVGMIRDELLRRLALRGPA
jgi:UDP-N-acetylmuramate--alanine ligase